MAVNVKDGQDLIVNPANKTENKLEVKKQMTINEQWLSFKKEINLSKARRHELVTYKMERAKVEMSIALSLSEIKNTNSLIETEEFDQNILYKFLETDKKLLDDFLSNNRIKSTDAVTRLEQATKTELEQNALIDELTGEKVNLERELDRIEGVLSHLTHCKDIVFKMSPVEWQEAQAALALSVQVQLNAGSDTKEPSPYTVTTNVTTNGGHHTLNRDNADKDEPVLYFSEPQELLQVMAELTEQNLSLIQNSTKVDETLEELSQLIEITTKKMKEDEDKVTLQTLDMKDRADREKTSLTKLKHRVLLHDSLKTADEDIMLNALAGKVLEEYQRCVDKNLSTLSTLEMLANIELRMYTLLEQLESIPEDFVAAVMRIKESEKRSRQQEEKLRLEREKHKERLKKCMQRSLGDTKKKVGRKLMPRYILVESNVKDDENDEETKISDEDELEAFLFGTEDNE